MNLQLKKTESNFGLELVNENGNSCRLDAAPSIGGTGKEFRPMELLAGSLAACMTIDLLAILQKQRIEVSHFWVDINATRQDAVPAPFERIELIIHVDKQINSERLQKHAELVLAKYCSVSASLDPTIQITVEVKQDHEN